ncbi:hypothetical protein [Microbispora bryophytorum]|uniref:hypothetical protein n=1 Tax=Microbispora bryophytorum TaxID=1460882 RepID=UPI003720D662
MSGPRADDRHDCDAIRLGRSRRGLRTHSAPGGRDAPQVLGEPAVRGGLGLRRARRSGSSRS